MGKGKKGNKKQVNLSSANSKQNKGTVAQKTVSTITSTKTTASCDSTNATLPIECLSQPSISINGCASTIVCDSHVTDCEQMNDLGGTMRVESKKVAAEIDSDEERLWEEKMQAKSQEANSNKNGSSLDIETLYLGLLSPGDDMDKKSMTATISISSSGTESPNVCSPFRNLEGALVKSSTEEWDDGNAEVYQFKNTSFSNNFNSTNRPASPLCFSPISTTFSPPESPLLVKKHQLNGNSANQQPSIGFTWNKHKIKFCDIGERPEDIAFVAKPPTPPGISHCTGLLDESLVLGSENTDEELRTPKQIKTVSFSNVLTAMSYKVKSAPCLLFPEHHDYASKKSKKKSKNPMDIALKKTKGVNPIYKPHTSKCIKNGCLVCENAPLKSGYKLNERGILIMNTIQKKCQEVGLKVLKKGHRQVLKVTDYNTEWNSVHNGKEGTESVYGITSNASIKNDSSGSEIDLNDIGFSEDDDFYDDDEEGFETSNMDGLTNLGLEMENSNDEMKKAATSYVAEVLDESFQSLLAKVMRGDLSSEEDNEKKNNQMQFTTECDGIQFEFGSSSEGSSDGEMDIEVDNAGNVTMVKKKK